MKINGQNGNHVLPIEVLLAEDNVVVLTASKAEEDIIKTYDLHANCYITKPVDLKQFMRVTKAVQDFWMTIVKLSPNGR